MGQHTITVKVPPLARHLAVLRTAVGSVAAREQFTLDQVDDLRMAVEEASVQILRRAGNDDLTMEVTTDDAGVEVRLFADLNSDAPVIDPKSFSWMILQALADDLRSDRSGARATITLIKNRPGGTSP